jgi:transposase InsO family protein
MYVQIQSLKKSCGNQGLHKCSGRSSLKEQIITILQAQLAELIDPVSQTLVRNAQALAHLQNRVAVHHHLVNGLLLKLVCVSYPSGHLTPLVIFYDFYHKKCRVYSGCIKHWFKSLDEARQIIKSWRKHYNHDRPHSSLGYQSPTQFELQAA